jgi:hypothetical protein
MDELAEDALVVRADLDEFFDASPAAVAFSVESRGGFLRGRMIDRIAADWSLKAIDRAIPLWDQFPRLCRATHSVFGGNDKKWILVPVINPTTGAKVRFKTSHNVRNGPPDERSYHDVAPPVLSFGP